MFRFEDGSVQKNKEAWIVLPTNKKKTEAYYYFVPLLLPLSLLLFAFYGQRHTCKQKHKII